MTTPHRGVPGDRLSSREIQVVICIANGLTNEQIAAQLSIGTTTVHSHTSRIYRKLGARDRAHAVSLTLATRQMHISDVLFVTPTRGKK